MCDSNVHIEPLGGTLTLGNYPPGFQTSAENTELGFLDPEEVKLSTRSVVKRTPGILQADVSKKVTYQIRISLIFFIVEGLMLSRVYM